MLGLPRTTEYNRRIPKQKFYEKIDISPALKKVFTEQVSAIYWRHKIAATTTNLAVGESVTEIEVFEIKLSSPSLDTELLRVIDREIRYHILFVLEYQGKYQAWIAYKESGRRRVGSYYHTEWMSELRLRLEGLSLDRVYENFVRQIGGESLRPLDEDESLGAAVERDERRRALQKQIDALQVKMRREKQLNRQMEISAQIKKLKREKGE